MGLRRLTLRAQLTQASNTAEAGEPAELLDHRRRRPSPTSDFKAADPDSDGSIDKMEFSPPAEAA
jgi:hypothetical protein